MNDNVKVQDPETTEQVAPEIEDKELFSHFVPMEVLGGRPGISTKMIATALRVKEASIVSKMRNSDFTSRGMKKFIEDEEAVRVDSKRGSRWFFTEEAGIYLVDKYPSQKENFGRNKQYAAYLRDPEERARAEEKRAREAEEKKAREAEEKKAGEDGEQRAEEPTPETKPEEKHVLLHELEEEVKVLRNDVRNLKVVTEQLSKMLTPKRPTKNELVDQRRRLSEASYKIALKLGMGPVMKGRSGRDPFGAVRELILGYFGAAIGKDCSEFRWMGRTSDELEVLDGLLLTFTEEGLPTDEDERKMIDAITKTCSYVRPVTESSGGSVTPLWTDVVGNRNEV